MSVRILAIVVAGLVAVVPAVAHAETPAELQAKGEALAKDGHWGEAIEQFKAADQLEKKAIHACLIALAYTRREAWPQAELFLAVCHERAMGEQLPDWVPVADDQMRDRLKAANLTEVTFEVQPANAVATITVSSFAPDEVFSPRTIHLPKGTHAIVAKAEGFPDRKVVVEIKDATPQHIVLDFTAKDQGIVTPHPANPGTEAPSKTPQRLMLVGAIALGGGAVSYGLMSYAWLQLHGADTNMAFNKHEGLYKATRITTIGFGIVGAGLFVTGLVLRGHGHEHAPAVGIEPLPGGGMVAVGFER